METSNSGVRLWDKKCNSGLILVYFSVSITSTKLWESNYSDYQQYLYDRIKGFIENSITPIGYRRISKIFNDEGVKNSSWYFIRKLQSTFYVQKGIDSRRKNES